MSVHGYLAARSDLLGSLPILAAVAALRSARTIYTCGNGGSFAQALHFSGELVSGMARKDGEARSSVTLGSELAALTAWANDVEWCSAYSRQLGGASERDALLAFTTSGRSRNVLAAVDAARSRGLRTVAITGQHGLATRADVVLSLPSSTTHIVQELTTIVMHEIAMRLEEG